MYQATTISPDAYTNGVCFLFIAWVLKLTFQENKINWRQFWITIGITALLLMVKLNAAFLLPLLLLLVWKGFEAKKMLPILAGVVGFLFVVLVLGWSLLVYSSYYSNVPGFGASSQAAYIFSHPLAFVVTLFHDLAIHGVTYMENWVATYGFGDWQVPPVLYPLFSVALGVSWLFSPSPLYIKGRTRTLLILTGILASLFTIFVIYLTVNPIGSNTIIEIQGWYFTSRPPCFWGWFLSGIHFSGWRVGLYR